MHNSLETTKKKKTLKSDAEHANQENEFDLLRVSPGVKKRKRQENRVASLQEGSLCLRDPERRAALDGYSLQSAATHREANLHRYTVLPPLVKAAGKKCFYARPIVVGLLCD